MRKKISKILAQILARLFKKPANGTFLIAAPNVVTLRLEGMDLNLTPDGARRLAAELPAMATIAERISSITATAEPVP